MQTLDHVSPVMCHMSHVTYSFESHLPLMFDGYLCSVLTTISAMFSCSICIWGQQTKKIEKVYIFFNKFFMSRDMCHVSSDTCHLTTTLCSFSFYELPGGLKRQLRGMINRVTKKIAQKSSALGLHPSPKEIYTKETHTSIDIATHRLNQFRVGFIQNTSTA